MESRVDAVAALVKVTVTPGMTPPPGSMTMPEIWPVRPCPSAELGAPPQRANMTAARTTLPRRCRTLVPPPRPPAHPGARRGHAGTGTRLRDAGEVDVTLEERFQPWLAEK